jgi:hypothetical protein
MSDATSTKLEPTRTELKPCPWCGAKAEVWQDSVRTWGLIEHKPDCWLAYDIPRHKQEIPRAEFAAWNRRADA